MSKRKKRPGPRSQLPFAGNVTVIPRGKSRLERVWAPARNREGLDAARLLARQTLLGGDEVLFAEPATNSGPGNVNIWICSASDVPERAGGAGVWVPETFLMEPGADGPRLAACQEGFEGQIWRDRTLVSTRWWPTEPDATAWRAFIEGTDAGLGLPEEVAEYWRELPALSVPEWRENMSLLSLGGENLARIFSAQRIASVLAVLLVIPAGLLVGSELKTRLILSELDSARAPLAALNQEVETAQAEAFEARGFADAMAKAYAPTLLIDALSELKTAAGAQTFSISYLNVTDDQIEVRLENMAAAEVPGLVSRLDKARFWSGVSGGVNRASEVVIKGKIVRAQGEN